MSDNEVEKFEITDYDLENEFGGKRRGRKMTKEQQIYGMWAKDSGGEEVRLTFCSMSKVKVIPACNIIVY